METRAEVSSELWPWPVWALVLCLPLTSWWLCIDLIKRTGLLPGAWVKISCLLPFRWAAMAKSFRLTVPQFLHL